MSLTPSPLVGPQLVPPQIESLGSSRLVGESTSSVLAPFTPSGRFGQVSLWPCPVWPACQQTRIARMSKLLPDTNRGGVLLLSLSIPGSCAAPGGVVWCGEMSLGPTQQLDYNCTVVLAGSTSRHGLNCFG